jgi:serine/threonine-protein kinase
VLECAIAASTGPVLEIDNALLESGRRVGSYQLMEQLGAGAMGEVWLAKHQLLVRPAAIKLIRTEQLGEQADEVRQRFEREARATAALESPNTVRLYDYGITKNGDLYYVMERLRGMDLDALVDQFGPLPVDRAVAFLVQACASLAEAHDAGMVHRDIKPANLFAAVMGKQCDVLKVLDFGMVRRDTGDQKNLTGGGMLGTPAFMSPEQILGEAVDGRADVYSLGCVAYWLLTGELVFEAPSVTGIIAAHVTRTPQPLSAVAKQPIPAELGELVLSCLEKKPEARPAGAHELQDALVDSELAGGWTDMRATEWWRTHTKMLKK